LGWFNNLKKSWRLHWRRNSRIAAVALALTLTIIVGVSQATKPFNREEGLESARLQLVNMSPANLGQHPLIYGSIYVDKFYELNPSTRTFTADGCFWLEWPAAVEKIIKDNKIDVASMVRLKNRIETWDSTLALDTEKPVELSAGRFQQKYTFSSRFYDDAINLRDDPFNTMTLPIVVELMPEPMTSKYADVLLIPQKRTGSNVGESGSISGYELREDRLQAYQQQYRNKFGSWQEPNRSQLRLEVVYSANTWSSFINWVLPLLVTSGSPFHQQRYSH
jgi:hypothetical protein